MHLLCDPNSSTDLHASLAPSCERLAEFLQSPSPVEWLPMEEEDDAVKGNDIAVQLEAATVGHELPGNKHVVFPSVDLVVDIGEFIIIAGAVGSGKSSLLSSLACAVPLLDGSIKVNRSRAYVSQKPFIMNGTVQDNILFGLDLDERRLNEVTQRAALKPDLDSFQHGLATTVGEAGVTLSGGQRARVTLARALYSDAQVFFFDDVLSAVDATTRKQLWEGALRPLAAEGKTVVLVTHQLQYLSDPSVSRVLLLKQGEIHLCGPWQEIVEFAGDEVLRFVHEPQHVESDDEADCESTLSASSGVQPDAMVPLKDVEGTLREITATDHSERPQ